MTTPFAALAVMTKSAHAYSVEPSHNTSLVLHPFAQLDPFVKEAGFFGDIGNGIWNNTMKPLGQAAGQMGKGVGQFFGGISEAAGNTLKAAPRAIGGALQGGMNAFKQQLTQPGAVDLGAIGQGAMDGGWNAGKQSLGWAADGAMKNVQGAGNILGGAAKTAWGMNPMVMGGRAAYGAGQGVMNGVQNFANDLKSSMMPQAGSATVGGPPPAAAPTAPSAAPTGTGGNPMMNIMMGGGDSNSAMGAGLGGGFNPGPPPNMGGGFNPGPPPNMGASAPRPIGGSPSPVGSAPSYQGPTAADYQRTMGSYNPNSPFDQRKSQAIDQIWQQNGGRVSPNQIYSNPLYSGLNKSGSLTPFAVLNADDMQKMAFNPAALIAKLTRQGGGALRRAGAKARINTPHATKPQNTPDVIQLGPSQASAAAATPSKSTAMIPHPTANAAPAAMPGDRRMAAGNWLKGLATKMDDPTVAGRINTGIAAGGGAGLLYGGHRMGHSSGMSEGLDKGFDTGADYGIQAALANAPKDPGLFGRIADVFTGQQAGPQAYDIQSLLDANKAQILKQLRAA